MANFRTELIYQGSVKNVFKDLNDSNIHYFAFTDDYSVFDWGKMPDKISEKGKSLSILGGVLFSRLSEPEIWRQLATKSTFEKFHPEWTDRLFHSRTYQTLCQTGLKHHFSGWVNDLGENVSFAQLATLSKAPLMKVRSIQVNRPASFLVDHHTLYRYTPSVSPEQPLLIPLEVVFRFGMPEGSSLQQRLDKNPDYFAELGLLQSPGPDTMFERPVLEFFTKLEPKDRFLTVQEAFLISELTGDEFRTLYELTLLLSLWLYQAFAERGIKLWDGKFEFAWTPEGLMLVDSIGPDELRLKYQGIQLSKEVIRQFYRGSAWEKAVKKAKNMALYLAGSDWKTICRDDLGESPNPLLPQQKHLVDNLYGALINYFLDASVIPTAMSFDEVISALKKKQPVEVPQ